MSLASNFEGELRGIINRYNQVAHQEILDILGKIGYEIHAGAGTVAKTNNVDRSTVHVGAAIATGTGAPQHFSKPVPPRSDPAKQAPVTESVAAPKPQPVPIAPAVSPGPNTPAYPENLDSPQPMGTQEDADKASHSTDSVNSTSTGTATKGNTITISTKNPNTSKGEPAERGPEAPPVDMEENDKKGPNNG